MEKLTVCGFFSVSQKQFVSLPFKKRRRRRISTGWYLAFLSGLEICGLKMQVCYFTGDMCKVDWQDNSERGAQSTKPSVIATPSLDTLSIRGLPRSTRPDRRGRVQGKEHASFGRAVMLCRVLNTTEPKWILQIFYASNWCMWQPKVRRRKRNDSENMRAREKRRKTGSSIFSEAQHPAAQTSSSLQKKNGVSVKYTSFFSEQENVALIDGCCAARLRSVRYCRRDQQKGLFLLRTCTCMRIHEVRWPPVSTFS